MKHCPTCTCGDRLSDSEQLLKILQTGQPHREVYRGDKTDRWFVTYGGPEVAAIAVSELVKRGEIVPVYDNTTDSFHVGKTLDMEATTKARKGRHREEGRLDIYTDGTQEIKDWH